MKRLILASASPRRLELLRQIGLEPDVIPANIPEQRQPGESPEDYVIRLSLEKAQCVATNNPEAIIIGSDTIVVSNGNLLEKPASKEEALAMFGLLSGSRHSVLTAVTVSMAGKSQSALSSSYVDFASITEAEKLAYWETGEPRDKAGGYAIQGFAAQWIKSIEGSYSGIMGLPLYETSELLKASGIKLL